MIVRIDGNIATGLRFFRRDGALILQYQTWDYENNVPHWLDVPCVDEDGGNVHITEDSNDV